MNELERIKNEIDEDLIKLGVSPELVYTTPPEVAPVFSSPDFGAGVPVAAETQPLADVPTVADVPIAGAEIITDGFYRETIKAAPFPERKRMSWGKKIAVACLVCTLGTGTLGLGIGAAIAAANFYVNGGIKTETDDENPTDIVAVDDINSVNYVFSGGEGAQEGSLSDMITLVEPSVVNVSAVFPAQENSFPGFAPGFGQDFGQEYSQENMGSASGIIFREDSSNVYIATNDHVVRGANSVTVVFNGSEDAIPATQVGMNQEADLAVISVAKRDLSSAGVNDIVIAGFGDSDEMVMGDAVIAIGNALGKGNIATQGIISATEKVIPVENRTLTVIQTDAAINFGNSGGALFNTSGEVIGINSAKLTANTVEGMGFSISSNIAVPIINDLMNTSSRPSLGIMGSDMSAELAIEEQLMDVPLMGVYVKSIIPGTGAENAGMQSGDIITGFDGSPVLNMEQLKEAISECTIGETVEVNILRSGQFTKLSVQLTETVVDGFNG